jgi:hypothetical protein
MNKTKIFLATVILLLTTLACNALIPVPDSNDAPTQIIEPSSNNDVPLTEAEVPRVPVGEAKAAFDSGEAVIVDVRSQDAYEASHIAGAQFITLGVFETDIANIDLNRERWIITYCT